MKFESPALPTPSPSPPSRALVLPTAHKQKSHHAQQLLRIRHAADQTRLLHLAQAVRAAAPSSSTSSAGVTMMRYSFQIEHDERGEKVLRRVTVIVPELAAGKAEADDARTALRQRPVSSFLLIPPPAAPRPRVRVAPPARRLSLPHLSALSLVPPAAPVPPFQSTAGSRRSVTPAPAAAAQASEATRAPLPPRLVPNPGEERVPSGAGLDRVAAWARDQRERVRRKRRGAPALLGPELEGEVEQGPAKGTKRQRRTASLGERRGRAVEPLRLV